MRRLATRFITSVTTLILALTSLAISPAHALPYDGTSGTVECLTTIEGSATATGFITIDSNVVTGNTDCSGDVAIPSNVTSIGKQAFILANGLKALTFEPDSKLRSIDDQAFAAAVSLESIDIPSGVTTIGWQAFAEALALKSVTFAGNSKLKIIGEAAFINASALVTITIPASVETIGDYAFNRAYALETINFAANSALTSINEGVFFEATSLKTITIPAKVTTIGDYAFVQSTSLTSITIPSGVSFIGTEAFVYAQLLTSVYFLGNAPATVGADAFKDIGQSPKAHIKLGATGFSKAGVNWNGLTIAIVDQRASSTVKPKVTGTAKVGKTLTAIKGTWTGSPIPKYIYQWYSCSKKVLTPKSSVPSNCKKISGATKSTLKLAKAQKRKYVTVLVTGTSKGTGKTSWLAKGTSKVK